MKIICDFVFFYPLLCLFCPILDLSRAPHIHSIFLLFLLDLTLISILCSYMACGRLNSENNMRLRVFYPLLCLFCPILDLSRAPHSRKRHKHSIYTLFLLDITLITIWCSYRASIYTLFLLDITLITIWCSCRASGRLNFEKICDFVVFILFAPFLAQFY